MAIPADKIEEIRSKASIVEVVSEFVTLKRSGRGYTGLCPFHGEKTPSFHVDDEKQLYHCFGCSKGGSIFDFVAEMKGLTFPEAVRLLASRYGVTIEETERRGGARDQEQRQRRAMVETLREAERLFGEILKSSPAGAPGREYLEKRGIGSEVSALFRLGYAPARWDLIEDELLPRLKESTKGLALDDQKIRLLLFSAGLIKRRMKPPAGESAADNSDSPSEANSTRAGGADSYYDFFRDRLIFPITRSDGVSVAFTGRALKNGEGIPKYLNTPETPLFSKRRTFFGLSQALSQIRKDRHLYLVEGNIDVVSMVQAGFPETIASCGTAVTPEHVSILKRLVSRATLIFDGDTAGKKAAASCFELFQNSGIDLQVVDLAPGDDPDSLCRRLIDRESIEAAMSSARRPLVQAFLDHCLAEVVSNSDTISSPLSSTQIGNAATRFVRAVVGVENPVEREALLRAAADRFGTSEASLAGLLVQAEKKKADAWSGERNAARTSGGQGGVPGKNNEARNSENRPAPQPENPGLQYAPQRLPRAAEYPTDQYRPYRNFNQFPNDGRGGWNQDRRSSGGWRGRDTSEQFLQSSVLPRSAFQKSDQKHRFLEQIVVSVLREPGLARTIRQLESFQGEGVMTAAIELFLESVVKRLDGGLEHDSFGQESSADGASMLLPGFSSGFSNRAENAEEQSKLVEVWSKLLSAAGLDPAVYINEAVRQTQVGGAAPEAMCQEIEAVSTRFSLREQVESLRERELGEGKESDKLEIIQEKLLKRRSIERLKRAD